MVSTLEIAVSQKLLQAMANYDISPAEAQANVEFKPNDPSKGHRTLAVELSTIGKDKDAYARLGKFTHKFEIRCFGRDMERETVHDDVKYGYAYRVDPKKALEVLDRMITEKPLDHTYPYGAAL